MAKQLLALSRNLIMNNSMLIFAAIVKLHFTGSIGRPGIFISMTHHPQLSAKSFPARTALVARRQHSPMDIINSDGNWRRHRSNVPDFGFPDLHFWESRLLPGLLFFRVAERVATPL